MGLPQHTMALEMSVANFGLYYLTGAILIEGLREQGFQISFP